MPATLDQPGYITAFAGTPDDDGVIRGVSIIQEGPALGHGTVVDRMTLSQVKKLAQGKKKLKAKTDHFGGVMASFGWFENFRIRSDKLLGDLHLLSNFEGRDQLLELVKEMPEHFGVSLFFLRDAPEMDPEKGALVRVSDLFSADLVDMPAANRDGIFEAKIDTDGESMAKDTSATTTEPTAIEALGAQVESLLLKVAFLTESFEAKEKAEKEFSEGLKVAYEVNSDEIAEKIVERLKKFQAAPTTPKPSADQTAPPPTKEFKSYREAHDEFIGAATGFARMRKGREFDAKYPSEAAYVAAMSA